VKFDAKWPNPVPVKSYLISGRFSDEVIYVPTKNKSVKCERCGALTGPWYNPSFGAVFCSEECLVAMWREYAEALKQRPATPAEAREVEEDARLEIENSAEEDDPR